jgi:hypothetical protein
MIRRRFKGHWHGWFYDETYRSNIDLIWPVSKRQVEQFMKYRFDVEYKCQVHVGARVIEYTNNGKGPDHQIICLHEWDRRDSTDVSFLAHECFHAAELILSRRGVLLGEFTTEPYAYMIESLMRRCLILLDTRRKIQA